MFGHSVFDSYYGATRNYAAEPALDTVVDYHPEAFSRFQVTNLGVTPEKTLKGHKDYGFHFTTKPTHSIKVKITGPGAGTMSSSWITLGPEDQFYRSGQDDKMHHVTAGGVTTTYTGANSTYYINWANPVEMCADVNSNTNTDGTCAAGCVSGFEEDSTGACVPVAAAASPPTTVVTSSGGATKKSNLIPILAVGGIIVVGAFAAMSMKKKKRVV